MIQILWINFTIMTPKSDPTIVQGYEIEKFWDIYGSIIMNILWNIASLTKHCYGFE